MMDSLDLVNTKLTQGQLLSTSLDECVAGLLRIEDLDAFFSRHPTLPAMLQATTEAELISAYHSTDIEHSRKAVQKTLFWLYQTFLADPLTAESKNQHHPVMVTIKRMIEKKWLAHETEHFAALPIATSPKRFTESLRELWSHHRSATHPLYEFLQHDASKTQMNAFFKSDSALNLLFFDLIAMAMVGARIEVRGELSRNMWDECGEGSDRHTHVNLYKDLLTRNRIELPENNFADTLAWQGLSGYNLFMLGGTNREHYFKLIGALAITELLDPSQYEKLVLGCKRLGFTDRDLRYYTEHIGIDVVHAEGWLQQVITPIAEKSPAAMAEIWIGANMRLNTVDSYYNHLLNSLIDLK
ncbi:iron-containing redox enzyme family protein [Serratia plymuthica]|nr:iron-containing redox enzyme family protein [Serratia plymuthica]